MITLKQNSRMRGLFMIEREQHNPDGSPIPGTKEVVAPWQDNLLTDSGLDNLAGQQWMRRCYIGSGSSPPAPQDTALAAPLGSATSSIVAGPRTDDYSSVVGTYSLPPGSATGIISEIGVGPNSGSITTRALVRDETGSPTTITKGPIDSLTVTYQIREYPDQGDTNSVVVNPHTAQEYSVVSRTIGGTAGDRLQRWNNYGAITPPGQGHPFSATGTPLVAWDSTSYVSGSSTTTGQIPAYQSGSHYLDLALQWRESLGNVAGGIVRIGSSVPTQAFRIQAQFDPPIDKDNTKTLQITLRKSWGRYVP